MKALTIKPEEGKKGRAFAATLLGYMAADRCWDGGTNTRNGPTRPIYLAYATSLAEAGPFTANLRAGRRAVLGDGRSSHNARHSQAFELLRSAGYAFSASRSKAGVITTAYLHDLFRLDPGMVDPAGVRFAILPDLRWAQAQAATLDLRGIERHVRALGFDGAKEDPMVGPAMPRLLELAPLATLFAAYLDRRVRAPLIPDARFFVQIMLGAVNARIASLTGAGTWVWGGRHGYDADFEAHDLDRLGFGEGIALGATHEAIEGLLAREVDRFYATVARKTAA